MRKHNLTRFFETNGRFTILPQNTETFKSVTNTVRIHLPIVLHQFALCQFALTHVANVHYSLICVLSFSVQRLLLRSPLISDLRLLYLLLILQERN